jgi:hypothetical protein
VVAGRWLGKGRARSRSGFNTTDKHKWTQMTEL